MHVSRSLPGYLDHVLDEDTRAEVETHLLSCESCRQEVRDLLQTRTPPTDQPAEAPAPEPSPEAPAPETPQDSGEPAPEAPNAPDVEPVTESNQSPDAEPVDSGYPDVPLPGDSVEEAITLGGSGQRLWLNRRRILGALGVSTALLVLILVWVVRKAPHVEKVRSSAPVPTPVPAPAQTPLPNPPSPAAKKIDGSDLRELQALIDSIPNTVAAPAPVIPSEKPAKTPAPAVPTPEETPAPAPAASEPEVSEVSEQTGTFPEWKGTVSGIHSFRTVVIQSSAQWRKLWREHSPKTRAPKVDFQLYTIIGVFAGQKPVGSAITIVETEETLPAALIARYRETKSSGNAGSESASHPFHLWTIGKTDLPVQFVATE